MLSRMLTLLLGIVLFAGCGTKTTTTDKQIQPFADQEDTTDVFGIPLDTSEEEEEMEMDQLEDMQTSQKAGSQVKQNSQKN